MREGEMGERHRNTFPQLESNHGRCDCMANALICSATGASACTCFLMWLADDRRPMHSHTWFDSKDVSRFHVHGCVLYVSLHMEQRHKPQQRTRAYSRGNWASASDHVDILHSDMRRRESSHLCVQSRFHSGKCKRGGEKTKSRLWAAFLAFGDLKCSNFTKYFQPNNKSIYCCCWWNNLGEIVRGALMLVWWYPHVHHQHQLLLPCVVTVGSSVSCSLAPETECIIWGSYNSLLPEPLAPTSLIEAFCTTQNETCTVCLIPSSLICPLLPSGIYACSFYFSDHWAPASLKLIESETRLPEETLTLSVREISDFILSIRSKDRAHVFNTDTCHAHKHKLYGYLIWIDSVLFINTHVLFELFDDNCYLFFSSF